MDEQEMMGGWEEEGVDTLTAAPDELAEGAAPGTVAMHRPLPLPVLLQASGRYEVRYPLLAPTPAPLPIQPIVPSPRIAEAAEGAEAIGAEPADALALAAPVFPLALLREDLRLDVDGRTPLMMASGTQYFRLTERLHWIARLARRGPNTYAGPIWYRDGATTTFPYTSVRIDVQRSLFPSQRTARVTFRGGGVTPRTVVLRYASAFLRDVYLEYDCAQGTTATLDVNTQAHPNRPPTLPNETLTLDTVFRRAGFRVIRTGDDEVVPIPVGPDPRWTDAEMHDAMQAYWSHFAHRAQWSLWSFFASLSVEGTSLGGIMFDDIGPNHRQGCATFVDSFIKNPPAGEPASTQAAWVRRMIFWTAAHEMGHCFNLAHSWQKALGTPWIPLANEPEARSFMNYPFRVAGGQAAFFADFEYRFSDGELLFLRHAPARFVRMGDADWFDHHGFEQAAVTARPTLELALRVNRPKATFAFLEPVVIELKLKNVSGEVQVVDERLLSATDHFTIVVKKKGRPARTFAPFARYCFQGAPKVLGPGESLYDSLFVAVGPGGWLIDEPGDYLLQAALHRNGEDIVSEPFAVRVRPPTEYLEEQIAQDVFVEDVGRVLAFDGTRVLDSANAALVDLVERLPEHRAAVHARIALAEPLRRKFKVLELSPERRDVPVPAHEAKGAVRPMAGDPDRAVEELQSALSADPETAAETLGHVDYNDYATRLSRWLEEEGEKDQAGEVAEELLLTLSGRGVIEPVLAAIRERVTRLGRSAEPRGRKKPNGRKSRARTHASD